MFEGKTITIIEQIGGNVAGQNKIYKLWTQGSAITVTNNNEVNLIDKVLKEAKKLKVDAKDYLKHMIDEESLFNEYK